MKTDINFYHTRICKRKTKAIASQFDLESTVQKQNFQQHVRRRLKTMVDFSLERAQFSPSSTSLKNQPINFSQAVKTTKKIQVCDKDNEYLTHEFVAEWQKMSNAKKQIYHKLRNQFVKKFPQYKTKYKKDQIDEQFQSIHETLNRTWQSICRESMSNRSNCSFRDTFHRSRQDDPTKTACFYSRSKKKYMYNTLRSKQILIQEQRQPPIPRMSFITYIKKYDQRKKFKRNQIIKGYNLIQSRERILDLEKQGTKSYMTLKKCLDDAIDVCIAHK